MTSQHNDPLAAWAQHIAAAEKIARWLQREFLIQAESLSPEHRQSAAEHAGVSHDAPPSDDTWRIVMALLRGL